MKILVTMPTQSHHRKKLQAVAPEEEFLFIPVEKVTDSEIQKADIIIGNLAPDDLKKNPHLKWVQLNSAGTDGYTDEGVLPEDAILTNATGAYGVAIAEHMIASLLCLMKKLSAYGENQRKHAWKDEGSVRSIYGSKTLVVGLGDIGSEFAKRMYAMGSQVTGIKRTIQDVPEYMERICQMQDIKECIKEADIVVSCLPASKETYHLFDADMFDAMKAGSYFVNVGRGSAVDSGALSDALISKKLAGAYIDVTDPEPLLSQHPLWDAPNLILTPHVSGGYHLQETHDRIVGIAAENLERFLNGEPLRNVIKK